jgi:aminoglycoside 3-N-acetyltransferase
MVTFDDLVKGLREVGIEEGDLLLVQSSYKSFGGVDGGPPTIIEALIHVLGEEGTLIMPAFSFDFCEGEPWDVRNSPSKMGIITELFRQDPRSCRVFHPIYSFSISGKHAEEICSYRYKSSYGSDSVFAKMRELDGKMVFLGVHPNVSITFLHHVEEMIGVDYRYMKEFTGQVTDWDGSTTEATFSMMVRDIDKGVITDADEMCDLLDEHVLAGMNKIGEATIRLFNVNEVFEYTSREIKRDPFLMHRIEKY